ncbi:hypothetical protein L484_005781 [Morus notabilis]|uniref:Apple domain-containing protein n=1 Tax=Morus notabilis TaxID=981085 RepID=W9RJQ4_9ROSA|nr:hypothetical protein L484_005781 [Morus notabilis]
MGDYRSESVMHWVWEASRAILFGKTPRSPFDLMATSSSQTLTAPYYTNKSSTLSHGEYILSRPKYNRTYSMLELESDGNLKAYAYYEHVDWDSWEVSFKLFGIENGNSQSECRLPRKCGELRVCENNQCVACSSSKGFRGWTKNCAPPTIGKYGWGRGCGGEKVEYFEVGNLAHFLNWYKEGDGPMKLVECKEKCNKDCGSCGVFYDEKASKCVVMYELYTLSKVSNSSIVGYIKMIK